MESAKKKNRGKKKIKRKNAKKTKSGTRKPLVKITPKLRPKVVNIKAVEQAVLASDRKGGEPEFEVKKTRIRVIGIGGGGGNIVAEIASKLKKSTFYIANTDRQALRSLSRNVATFQFGEKFTHGLGTGMDPRVAEEAANAEREKIKKIASGQDLIIVVAALGGGTGSGAAPVFAQVSKSLGNLTYGIFTLPFAFEGAKKKDIAKNALEKLRPHLNAITVLPNERVFEVVPKATPFSKTLSYINNMLSDSLEGLIDTIYDTGVINIDFADLRTILAGNGKTTFLNTIKLKKGEKSNIESFEKVFDSPLYPYTIDKARGLLLNIVARKDLKLLEVDKILTSAAGRINKEARIIFGVGQESAPPDLIKVTLLATGCQYGGQVNIKKESKTAPKTEAPAAPSASKNKSRSKKNKTQAPRRAQAVEPGRAKRTAKQKKEKIKKTPSVSKAIPIRVTKKPSLAASVPAAASGAPQSGQKDAPGNSQDINDQFEVPVRKNALQVKKEIEMEEKEMLEKEKAWEVPAFLRKKNK
jgi:cell division protein FtsZ